MTGARKLRPAQRPKKGNVMNHRFALTALLVAAIATSIGCSSASESPEEIETTVSALEECGTVDSPDCDSAGKDAYVLSGFAATAVPGEYVLSGNNGFGAAFNATVSGATNFQKANLNKFLPGEPTRPLLVQYNASIQNYSQVIPQVSSLFNAGASARITLKAGKVKAFRPVPAFF